MRGTVMRRWTLVAVGLVVAFSISACAATRQQNNSSAGHSDTITPTASPTRSASPPAATSTATPGPASASSAPSESAWLAASEVPFDTTYNWSLFAGNANSAPIGTAEADAVYYVSPDTVFQQITSCGSPSLLLSTSVGAWQRQFQPTSGDLLDLAGQWISVYPDAARAQAAWHGLQASYAGCLAQEGNPQISLRETAQTQDAMAWFHSTNSVMIGSVAPDAHEYFVLHENQIAYLYVEGGAPALATTPDDAQVLATIARHLNT